MSVLPKKITIGNIPYEVEIVEGYIETEKNHVLIGRIDYTKQKIQVSDETQNESRSKVFIHEITHGILEEYGMARHNKEDFVDRLSTALYDFLMRNDLSFLQSKEDVSKPEDRLDSFQYALNTAKATFPHIIDKDIKEVLSAVKESKEEESRSRKLPINNERSLHVPIAELTEETPEHWETGIKVKEGIDFYRTRYECPSCKNKGKHYVPKDLEHINCHSCSERMQKIPATTEGFPQRDNWGNFFIAGEVQQHEPEED